MVGIQLAIELWLRLQLVVIHQRSKSAVFVKVPDPSLIAVLPDAQVISQPFRVVAGCIFIGATQSATRAIQLYGPVWTARTIRDKMRQLVGTHFIGIAGNVIVVDEQCL